MQILKDDLLNKIIYNTFGTWQQLISVADVSWNAIIILFSNYNYQMFLGVHAHDPLNVPTLENGQLIEVWMLD